MTPNSYADARIEEFRERFVSVAPNIVNPETGKPHEFLINCSIPLLESFLRESIQEAERRAVREFDEAIEGENIGHYLSPHWNEARKLALSRFGVESESEGKEE